LGTEQEWGPRERKHSGQQGTTEIENHCIRDPMSQGATATEIHSKRRLKGEKKAGSLLYRTEQEEGV